MTEIAPETPSDHDAVEALIERAFGPGRFTKSAERLREGNTPDLSLSVVARDDWGRVIGCARMWPVVIGATPAILLGPFAVDKDRRSAGLGQALVETACGLAKEAGHALVILVGDAPYFGRAGFVRAPAAVRMPGPVDPRRVLVLPLKEGAAEGLSGLVSVP